MPRNLDGAVADVELYRHAAVNLDELAVGVLDEARHAAAKLDVYAKGYLELSWELSRRNNPSCSRPSICDPCRVLNV